MASITVAGPAQTQTTPFHLSRDGALLLSLIDPLHLTGTVVDAYEVAGGLITVESTPDGPDGDYDITAWLPLSVSAAEDRHLYSLIEPDLIDPDDRLPLVISVFATDALSSGIAGAVQRAREYLLDRAAHAAASHVRRPVVA